MISTKTNYYKRSIFLVYGSILFYNDFQILSEQSKNQFFTANTKYNSNLNYQGQFLGLDKLDRI